MALPATGTTPSAGGYLTVDNRLQGGTRSGLIAVLFRDALGTSTDISPHDSTGAVKWSPFATDGKLRDDLFAQKLVNGVWVTNPVANEGWYLAGAFGEGNGPSTKPSIDTDDQMIEQADWPFDILKTKQDEPFTFQAIQNLQPAIIRLRNNLPLATGAGAPLVEVPGAAKGWAQPLEDTQPIRQFLLYGIRKREGKYVYEIDAFDACRLTNVGERKLGKKGTAAELTYKPVPSGLYMAVQDGEYKPIIKHTHVGGDYLPTVGSPVTKWLVTLGSPSAGSFTLTVTNNLGVQTATGINYNAANTAVKTAIEGLSNVGSGNATVVGSAGGPYTVTLPLGGTLSGSGAGLTGGTFSVAPAP